MFYYFINIDIDLNQTNRSWVLYTVLCPLLLNSIWALCLCTCSTLYRSYVTSGQKASSWICYNNNNNNTVSVDNPSQRHCQLRMRKWMACTLHFLENPLLFKFPSNFPPFPSWTTVTVETLSTLFSCRAVWLVDLSCLEETVLCGLVWSF